MNSIRRTKADLLYACLLHRIMREGDSVHTRNHDTLSHIGLLPVRFTSAPLITWRKTAWRKALREMEWFLDGNPKCPDELLDWWQGQLDPSQRLLGGYGQQFRASIGCTLLNEVTTFDQIQFVINALKNNPTSRRIILTSWNPYDQANITSLNHNPNTPTTCHNTMTQFFVRNDKLFMKTYQRSADMLLGVPHNWIQSWGMLVWLAKQANLGIGHMDWSFGDAHIYKEETHLTCVSHILQAYEAYEREQELLSSNDSNLLEVELVHSPASSAFKESDFALLLHNYFMPPVVTDVRPTLL